MTGRERIAGLKLDDEQISAIIDSIDPQMQNEIPNHVRLYSIAWRLQDTLISRMKRLGYTRQPEPPQDRVEAVRRYIDTLIVEGYGMMHQVDKNQECAREILKLFPEQEGGE